MFLFAHALWRKGEFRTVFSGMGLVMYLRASNEIDSDPQRSSNLATRASIDSVISLRASNLHPMKLTLIRKGYLDYLDRAGCK